MVVVEKIRAFRHRLEVRDARELRRPLPQREAKRCLEPVELAPAVRDQALLMTRIDLRALDTQMDRPHCGERACRDGEPENERDECDLVRSHDASST